MPRPVAARILLGLATALFASGCCVGFIGLHPATKNPALTRLGILLSLNSLPPWMTVLQWQTRQATDTQLRDARLSGYQTAMNQMDNLPEAHPHTSNRVPRQGRPMRNPWKQDS